MTRVLHTGFTLIELMLVVAIMGLMGTISVGGYRAMRRGMEERGVKQNVQQFISNARQRAMIDRQPTAVYFWNETLREESDDGTSPIVVVGHAIAVRQAGRFSYVKGNYLVDEFGDLAQYAGTDEEGEKDDAEAKEQATSGMTMNLYKMVFSGTLAANRSLVSVSTLPVTSDCYQGLLPMLSDEVDNDGTLPTYTPTIYAYYKRGGSVTWAAGDAYGFEFATLTLPHNYIFGGSGDYNESVGADIKEGLSGLFFRPTDTSASTSVKISALRPGTSGALEAKNL